MEQDGIGPETPGGMRPLDTARELAVFSCPVRILLLTWKLYTSEVGLVVGRAFSVAERCGDLVSVRIALWPEGGTGR